MKKTTKKVQKMALIIIAVTVIIQTSFSLFPDLIFLIEAKEETYKTCLIKAKHALSFNSRVEVELCKLEFIHSGEPEIRVTM